MTGYAEKIYEPPEQEERESTSAWVYVGVVLGVLFAILIIGVITFLVLRVRKLQEILTSEEIREFMYGVEENSPQAQSGQVENALKFPYDKSYEISKDKLKISKRLTKTIKSDSNLGTIMKRDALLGTGQFGCVYVALIEDDEKGNREVALKMAKSDCPANALKSLLSEIKILTYLGKHPNIVCILGAFTSELSSGIVYVATELCTLGSLEDYLRNNQINKTVNRYANAPRYKVMVDCWHKVPNERPTFTDLKLSTGHLFENAARGGNNYVENTYYSNQPPPAYSVSA
ncbi:Platelet-derived growth factor receptor beta [Orchesella cincta]|uniref:Platelet-derived growth factor receptor beta n=1 Tax=Orchesella cincta TaxID=48709 RepID=A0A1D2MNM7_ORCCI|nr:Platelet-derived growth factor receptor beta [Orchesella cincta]